MFEIMNIAMHYIQQNSKIDITRRA